MHQKWHVVLGLSYAKLTKASNSDVSASGLPERLCAETLLLDASVEAVGKL